MMIAFFAVWLLVQPLVCATIGDLDLGIHFENGNQDAPLLKLDYATYRATYNETYDVNFHFMDYLLSFLQANNIRRLSCSKM
jgi:hypothetical protein